MGDGDSGDTGVTDMGSVGISSTGLPGSDVGFSGGDGLAAMDFGPFNPLDFDATAGGNFGGMATSNMGIQEAGEDNSLFGKAMKGLANFGWGQALGKAGSAIGLGPIGGLALAGLTAPQGKGAATMGGMIGNALTGPFGGVIGLANAFGAGIPTLGESIANQGGYSGGQGYGTGFSEANMASPSDVFGTFSNGLGSLASLYSLYNGAKNADNYTNSLSSMYGQNSPYAQMLRQKLERQDAAGGRRSNVGGREVELQARLADAASRVSGSVMQGNQNSFENKMKMAQQLAGMFSKNGPMTNMYNGLSSMFSGPQTQYGAGLNFNSNPFDSFDYTPSFGFGGG